jgi:D-alanine-D-alanine ligase
MAKKLKIGVIFGGRSGEHEVSLVSATSIIKALNKKKYEVIPIGIDKNGQWLASGDPLRALKERNLKLTKLVTPIINPKNKKFIRVGDLPSLKLRQAGREIKIDVVFPVLHGTYGEDGTIQGLFEMANIAYVGCGVLGSALGMDKVVQKQIFEQAGLLVVKYVWFLNWRQETRDKRQEILRHIEQKLKYSLFVKPANLGSSVGISKAHNRKELIKAINLAAGFDRKVIVEEGVNNAREIECGVLGNDNPRASVLGEIIPSNEFYDYNSKYVDGQSEAIIPAKLSPQISAKIKDLALKAFKSLDLAGMARIDFLVEKNTNKIFINEPNTIPGFTSISMYPKLWEASGLSYEKLLDNLVKLAIERHKAKNQLRLSYEIKNKWYNK